MDLNYSNVIAGVCVSDAFGFIALIANLVQLRLFYCRKDNISLFDLTLISITIANILCIVLLVSLYSVCVLVITGKISINHLSTVIYLLFVTNVFLIVSLIHIVFIALQRLFAVLYPIRFRQILTKKLCIIFIAILWIISVAIFTTFVFLQLKYSISYLIFAMESLVALCYSLVLYYTISRRPLVATRMSSNVNRKVTILCIGVTISFIAFTFPTAVLNLYEGFLMEKLFLDL